MKIYKNKTHLFFQTGGGGAPARRSWIPPWKAKSTVCHNVECLSISGVPSQQRLNSTPTTQILLWQRYNHTVPVENACQCLLYIHIITNRQRPYNNREKGNDMIQSTQEDASDIDMTFSYRLLSKSTPHKPKDHYVI